jgi:DNA-binding NarL/FixJ family response regulator
MTTWPEDFEGPERDGRGGGSRVDAQSASWVQVGDGNFQASFTYNVLAWPDGVMPPLAAGVPGMAGDSGRDIEPVIPVRVMVVDDHPIWRAAVARDLTEAGYDVAAVVGEGTEAIRAASAARPDVVVLDLQLPDLPGVEVIRELAAADPAIRVLMLSASGEQQDVLDALKAGALGYLVKSAKPAEFLEAVGRTAAGDPVFTVGLAALVLGEYRRLAASSASPLDPPRLTGRETEVLRLVAKGLSYKQVAERLAVSHRTVQSHVQHTLGKLQLHSRIELTRYAIKQGFDKDA